MGPDAERYADPVCSSCGEPFNPATRPRAHRQICRECWGEDTPGDIAEEAERRRVSRAKREAVAAARREKILARQR